MKRIGITQRVVYHDRIKERRDVLDQRWHDFANALGVMLIPIPNNLKQPSSFADELNLEGLIFSGGNNISFLGREIIEGKSIQEDDVAYERDTTEIALIDWAIEKEKPIIGVCRGMQVLSAYFGGSQNKVDPEIHVAKEHVLNFEDDETISHYTNEKMVNSYHNWGILQEGLAKPLIALATYKKSEVEALRHPKYSFFGIMWHPERYLKFKESDLAFFKAVLQ